MRGLSHGANSCGAAILTVKIAAPQPVAQTRASWRSSGSGPASVSSGSGASSEIFGVNRSNHRGNHQLAGPTRCISDGTSIVRTMNASTKIALPSPMPNSLITRASPRMNDVNTAIMISPAAVMMPPVSAWPTVMARRLSWVCTHSSCIRLTRNTW